MKCSLPGSSVHGILQARTLERVAIPFSGDLPNPGIEPRSPSLQVDYLPDESLGKPPWWLSGKEFACQCRRLEFDLWVGKIPWRRQWQPIPVSLGFPHGSAGKESTCNVEDPVLIPGLGRSPEKGMATHSSILAWRISWTVAYKAS